MFRSRMLASNLGSTSEQGVNLSRLHKKELTQGRAPPLSGSVRLHMRLYQVLSILVLSVLICGATQACAGGGVPDHEQIPQWVVDRTAAAAHVFLARIT